MKDSTRKRLCWILPLGLLTVIGIIVIVVVVVPIVRERAVEEAQSLQSASTGPTRVISDGPPAVITTSEEEGDWEDSWTSEEPGEEYDPETENWEPEIETYTETETETYTETETVEEEPVPTEIIDTEGYEGDSPEYSATSDVVPEEEVDDLTLDAKRGRRNYFLLRRERD